MKYNPITPGQLKKMLRLIEKAYGHSTLELHDDHAELVILSSVEVDDTPRAGWGSTHSYLDMVVEYVEEVFVDAREGNLFTKAEVECLYTAELMNEVDPDNFYDGGRAHIKLSRKQTPLKVVVY